MKKLLGIFALAVAGAGCQPNRTSDKAVVGLSAAVPAADAVAVDTLLLAMLEAYDLSPVVRTLPADPDDSVEPMNGFFGAGYYRIELVVSDVKRDPQRPTRYLLRGKDRYKGRVIPFAGTIELTQVQRQPISRVGILEAAYTALGHFKITENATSPKAGTFQGRIAIDWAVEKGGKVRQFTPSVKIPHLEGLSQIREFESSTKTPTLGGGILYEGTWTSATGQVKPAVWAADLLAYHGPQVLSDFAVGGRMLSVNPKYAKLGWNEYWQNDEWWATSPKPRLNL